MVVKCSYEYREDWVQLLGETGNLPSRTGIAKETLGGVGAMPGSADGRARK